MVVLETGWPRWVDLAAALEEVFQLPTTALRLAYHSPADGEEIVLASARELDAMFRDLREAGLGLEFQPVRLLVQRLQAVKAGPERGWPGRSLEWDEQRARENLSRSGGGRRGGRKRDMESWAAEWERKPEARARHSAERSQVSPLPLPPSIPACRL